MAESLYIEKGLDKEELYTQLYPQLKALIEGETNLIANMANFCAVLNEAFGFLWTGFYLVDGNELVLGPFQGPIACTRIQHGKGVCGTAWKNNETIVVPNVDEFPGHIACSSLSKSEIVVPGRHKNGEVAFILDIDSAELNSFDAIDEKHLGKYINLIEACL